MDPIGATTALVDALRYLKEVADKVKENKERCQQLAEHGETVVKKLEEQCKGGIPPDLDAHLTGLTE
jgi:hypothetical protein